MLRIVDLILGNDDTNFLKVPPFESLSITSLSDPNAPRCLGYLLAEKQSTERPRVVHTHLPAEHVPKSFWDTKGVKVRILNVPIGHLLETLVQIAMM